MTTMKKISAFAIALSLLTVPLYAALKASAVRSGNYTFAQGTSNLVPLDNAGTTQLTFSGSGKHVITYSAECAVSAAAGNAGTWLNIDIELIPNIATGVVQVLAPTAGTSDAFCTSNETAGADGWGTQSITVPTPALPGGNHILRIRANVQNGVAGNSGWLGDTALVVTK